MTLNSDGFEEVTLTLVSLPLQEEEITTEVRYINLNIKYFTSSSVCSSNFENEICARVFFVCVCVWFEHVPEFLPERPYPKSRSPNGQWTMAEDKC